MSRPITIPSSAYGVLSERQEVCTQYLKGYVRLTGYNRKDVIEYYLLPRDLLKFREQSEPHFPYAFVLMFDKNDTPYMGLTMINPGDYMSGHAVTTELMTDDGLEDAEIIISGEVVMSQKNGFFVDRSGHFAQYLLPLLPKDENSYDAYVRELIAPLLSELLRVPMNFISYREYEGVTDNNVVMRRFKKNMCKKHMRFQVYADEASCLEGRNQVAQLCEDEFVAGPRIMAARIKSITAGLSPELRPLIPKLEAGTISDADIFALLKNMGKVPGPITPINKNSYLNLLRAYYVA